MARPNWDFDEPNDDRRTSFAYSSFAEGVSRRAYRAMRWKPAGKYRRKGVVKEYKDSYAWAKGDWDTAVSIYDKTKELAGKFNTASEANRPIHVVDYDVQKVISRSVNGTPKLGEYVLVEDYLEGDFEKFISNTGWVKQTSYTLMPAFAHWTWVHTRGQLLVTDLQGVRYDDKYVLTDPCILSTDKTHGATDLAVVGMAMFFVSHQCNGFCRSLNIAHKRPNMVGMEMMVQVSQVPTSYLSKEDYEKLPVAVRAEIRVKLSACF